MKIKLTGASAVLLAAIAVAPASPQPVQAAQLIPGNTWTCNSLADGMTVIGKQTYKADGTSEIGVTVSNPGNSQDPSIEIIASGVGTWKLTGNTFDEELSRLTITSSKLDGQVYPNETFQPMLDESMVNQPLTATITTITTSKFNTIDPQGVVTNCTR